MSTLRPQLDVLPPAQRALWPRLGFTRERFTLYGGTAIALRLGHRVSVDFDFFSNEPLNPAAYRAGLPLLAESELIQLETNTLTVLRHEPPGPVKLSFFGGLSLGCARPPEMTDDGVIRVASLSDLLATKLNTVYQRAEFRDYMDVHAILNTGITLADGLEFARQVYGPQWNPMLCLQALCYYGEPQLQALPETVKLALTAAVRALR